mmetsp:Transcript_14671/g.31013  ORF Transcript_14671/g.31013 Transcript_14671/m.31013 type:complete len:200 (-) Transcript_14671:1377-1976(-)
MLHEVDGCSVLEAKRRVHSDHELAVRQICQRINLEPRLSRKALRPVRRREDVEGAAAQRHAGAWVEQERRKRVWTARKVDHHVVRIEMRLHVRGDLQEQRIRREVARKRGVFAPVQGQSVQGEVHRIPDRLEPLGSGWRQRRRDQHAENVLHLGVGELVPAVAAGGVERDVELRFEHGAAAHGGADGAATAARSRQDVQ